MLTFNQAKSIVYFKVFLSLFLLPWAPNRGAFMAKGRHSRVSTDVWGEVAPKSLPWIRYWPAGKIPPFVKYTLLYAGIMSLNLNHNEYKLMNVIRNYNNKYIGCALLEFQLACIPEPSPESLQ